jgi:hypothetical protein
MKRKKIILTSVLLSGSMGLGAHALFAQTAPGPSEPKPGPRLPQQTEPEPTIPGRPAPGLPQTEPLPGRPGTVPEQIQPRAPRGEEMVISSEDIKKAQEALKAKGMDPGPATGRMDAQTQEALSKFQKANDLPATGVLDEKTAAKLGVALNKSHEGAKPQQPQHGSPESGSPTGK